MLSLAFTQPVAPYQRADSTISVEDLEQAFDIGSDEAIQIIEDMNSVNHDVDVDEAMIHIDSIIQGYGVELIRNEERYYSDYWGNVVGVFVNMGDTYTRTIVYSIQDEIFYLTTWGDFYEGLERRASVNVTEKGTKIHRNDEGKYHRTDGPAVEYPSGFGFYYLNGKKMTKEEWEGSEKESSLRLSFIDDFVEHGSRVRVILDNNDLTDRIYETTSIPSHMYAGTYAKTLLYYDLTGEIISISDDNDSEYTILFYDTNAQYIQEQISEEYDNYIYFRREDFELV